MQVENIIDVHIISYVKMVGNAAYPIKLRHISKWYKQTYDTEFVIPLHIVFINN